MARSQSGLPAIVCRYMRFLMAVELPVELPIPMSDALETLSREWMLFTRRNKALHEAASAHCARLADGGLITTVVLRSVGGLITILLGAVSAEDGTGACLNISQVAIGLISIVSAAIISASSSFSGRPRRLYAARPRCIMPSSRG